jgi:hypothetical protein
VSGKGSRTLNLTASMLRAYKSCPRLYELQYIEQLKPTAKSEALETGSNYHDCLEHILTGSPYEAQGLPAVMAGVFDSHIPWRDWGIKAAEVEFRNHVSRGLYFAGKIDAICEDGTPIEHKTTKDKIDEKYVYKLNWDDQVPFYLLNLSYQRGEWVTRLRYTAIRKPSIKFCGKDKTEEDYFNRVREWYETDTEEKINTFLVVRSVDELKAKEAEIKALAKEIRGRKVWYRNPSHCRIMGCMYSPICLDYDPEILVGFEKKERRNEELACKF